MVQEREKDVLMKFYVLTSTRYAKLLGEFAERFEKFCGEQFWVFVSHTDLHHWSDGVIDFLHQVPEEYFILLHEDFYLTQPVDKGGLQKLWDMREKYDRISLLGNHTPERTYKRGKYFIHRKKAEYQFSFEASIQRREFLLKYLAPGMDPWEAERERKRIARGRILSSAEPVIWYEDKSRQLTIQ